MDFDAGVTGIGVLPGTELTLNFMFLTDTCWLGASFHGGKAPPPLLPALMGWPEGTAAVAMAA